MRLLRLDLTRYGRFTDHALHFPRPAEGAPDLHIVYGDNEAGKTTAHTALLDLLYGIEERSPYNFLHDYKLMQLGAALEVDGAVLELVRLKRRTGSLTDPAGQPLPEAVLAGALAGLTREDCRSMFSLDDETLEKGGESLLASRGDLGQLLFAASAGLAELSERLEAVRAEAEAFRRASGRGDSALRRGEERLRELAQARRDTDVLASEHAALRRARDEAEAAHGAAAAEVARLVAAHESVRSRQQALVFAADLAGLRAALAALADLPEAPAEWQAEVAQLREDQARLTELERATAAQREATQRDLEAAAVEAPALALGPRLEALAGLQARAATAEEDIPKLDRALSEVRSQSAALLVRLGHPGDPDPARLLLSEAVTARLRRLIEARGGLEAAAATAVAEARAAQDRAAAAAEAAPEGEGTGALAATVARLRGADPAGGRRRAAEAVAVAEAELAARLAALAPWGGEVAELAALPVPPADELDRWKRETPAAQRAAEAAEAECARLTGEAARMRALLAAGSTAEGISDAELAALRTAREAAWAAHRVRLTAATADAFEAALRAHDLGMEARAGAGAAAARRAERAEALAETEAALAAAGQRRDEARGRLAALLAEEGAALADLSPDLPPEWSAEALADWLDRRAAALAAGEALQRARAALATAEAAEAEAVAALAAAGVAGEGGFAALLDAAQTRLDVATAAQERRRQAQETAREAARRAEALGEAEAALEGWATDWAAACAETWLGPEAEPEAVRAALDLLAPLGAALREAAGLADRIVKMTRDRDAFAAGVAALAEGLALAPSPPLAQWQELSARAEAARRAAAARAAAEARLRTAEAERGDCLRRMAALEARRAEICAHLGVETLAAAAERLAALVDRARLRGEIGQTRRRLAAALGIEDADAAETALAGADAPALAAEAATLAAERAAAEAALEAALAARAEARTALAAVGGDDAVARIEAERAALLEELDAGVRRHLRLRLGALAVEAGLRAYRERHQSGMLARASEAFAAISRGAYRGLATRPGGGPAREELIAMPAQGGAKAVRDLSKGTRFQLYLALRVAGHAEFARTRRPLPFVADDIMETFDDHRAAAAFDALAGMARRGQVIYLTHHRHLCEIAARVVPGVQVQALGSAGA